MENTNRGTVILGTFLIAIGVVYLLLNLVPGIQTVQTWPVIFFFLAAAFFLPVFLWPSAKRGLAGLYIPGSIMLVLGLIFTYDVLTLDWASWAYAWLLIPGGVGLGLFSGRLSAIGGGAAFRPACGCWA